MKKKNKKQKTWGEVEKVEKTKLEGTVLFAGAGDLAKCIQEMVLLKPQTFKTLDSYHFSSSRRTQKASANFSFVCFLPSRTQEARKQLAISYEFTVYLLFLSDYGIM